MTYLSHGNPVRVDQLEQVELLLLRDLVVLVQPAAWKGVTHQSTGLIKIKRSQLFTARK